MPLSVPPTRLSVPHPSVIPLLHDGIQCLGNGNYSLTYTKPPAGVDVPALYNIEPISTEIIDPANKEGGREVRRIEISQVDGEEVMKRIASKDEKSTSRMR
ncbi:hypothetical protein PSPO01_16105 [Paraphaeosphaeria sporulosa]